VNEKRGEAFAQASWRLSPEWAVEAGAHFEFSTIAAQGIPSRSFEFVKPRLLVSWAPIANTQIRVRAERVVGQLDFNNFIASSNFSNNGISAGNIMLRPDQRWQFEGDFEYHFWDKGALVLSYTREDITDLVDYVPIGGGLDGPGNIPKSTNNIYDLEMSLPLDRLGAEGTTIKPSLVWKDAALPDPVTGVTRQISNVQDKKLVVDILQDIQSWNSSLDLTVQTSFQKPFLRIAQVTDYRIYPLYVAMSWDYKPSPDLDFLVKLQNIVPYQFDQIEYNYAGPRDVSPLISVQDTHTHSEPFVYIQLRKAF
jgi:TonB dependent receptor